MMFTVYHADKMPDGLVGFKRMSLEDTTGFSVVAMVEAQNLEEVFAATNHIDKPWWENSCVKFHKANSRSTSVGDAVVSKDGVYMCECAGWSKV